MTQLVSLHQRRLILVMDLVIRAKELSTLKLLGTIDE
jgi:hypothetical protein